MMKLTKEQKVELKIALDHWYRVCKVADKEMEKPYSKQTEVVIGDLKRAKEYLESTFGCWVYHPLMDFGK